MTTKIRPSTLENTAVSAGTYGGASQHAVYTVDSQGRLTYAANATPSIATSQLTGTVSATQVANNQTYGINVSGNSGTVTNGVYTSGSYSDPSWLTITKTKVGLSNVDNTADSSKSVSYASTAGRAYPYRSDGGNLNFYWSGQSGQPTWLWGGSDGTNMYIYNPSNFSVNYASSAGSVAWSNVTSKPAITTSSAVYVGKTFSTSYFGEGYDILYRTSTFKEIPIIGAASKDYGDESGRSTISATTYWDATTLGFDPVECVGVCATYDTTVYFVGYGSNTDYFELYAGPHTLYKRRDGTNYLKFQLSLSAEIQYTNWQGLGSRSTWRIWPNALNFYFLRRT